MDLTFGASLECCKIHSSDNENMGAVHRKKKQKFITSSYVNMGPRGRYL